MSGSTSIPEKEGGYKPSITDLISLEIPLQSQASPNGSRIAYTVRTTDWSKNQYESLCFIYDSRDNHCSQLTRSGEVIDFHWVDEDSLAVLKGLPSETENKPQIWLFENLQGEPLKITDHKTGVQSFKPFSEGILFLADNPERSERKVRRERFGTLTRFEQEESASALYYTSIQKTKEYSDKTRRCSEEEAKSLVRPVVELSKILKEPLKIVSFHTSPMNDAIYLNCRIRDDLVYQDETSCYRLKLDPERALQEHITREEAKSKDKEDETIETDSHQDVSYLGELTKIMLPKGASIAGVSPNGTKLLILHRERDNMFYTQVDLWVLDLQQAESFLTDESLRTCMKKVSQNLDRDLYAVQWVNRGIFVSYADRSKQNIARINELGEVRPLSFQGVYPYSPSFHISKNGFVTFIGANREMFPEVFVSKESLSTSRCNLKQLTSLGQKSKEWDIGRVETIKWKSRDGTEIEGVLRKPLNFDPKKQYPLVFMVHGGPRANSTESLIESGDIRSYPSIQFVHKDILVLKPNYRGSSGYGQAFTELNKDNLGVGDLWDLESAIDYLISQGFIDATKVGCMGWSQGGYISAFATTHSHRFRAVSVGAGISDWYTYHIANDIPQFTTHYLSGTPFKNRDLYLKTSPMTKISEAKTPTLIQHGAKDQRVPLANATELYRGLKDMGVPVELFIYPEFAHPITKPRENRAVMQQNLTWFSHYLLGEELDFQLSAHR